MALDPNIALGVRPIEIANPLAQYAQVTQIQNAQNQNALARAQMAEYERARTEEEGLRNYLARADLKTPEARAELMKFGKTGLGYAKALSEQEKAALERKKLETETTGADFDLRIKKANKAISDIGALSSPAEAIASIDKNLADGNIDTQKAETLKASLAQAPSFGAWQKNMLVNILDAKDRLAQEREQTRLGYEGQRVGFEGERVGLEKKRVGMEGQRLGLEGQRVGLEGERVQIAKEEAERKKAGLEALPPKEIQKREAALPQATSAIKGFESKSDSFVNDLIKLRDHPGLSQITGLVAGRVPALTADGRAAQALYDKVVAKGGFQALQDLRDASKTGGALGNVSNQEGKQLTASFSAIDRRQDAKDVKAAIEQAIGDVQGAKTRMREAYDATYSYKSGAEAPASNIDALLNKYK
jgi:hypothetical protein